MNWSLIFEHAPSILALLIMVGMFLRYLGKRDQVLKEISDVCHENQRGSTMAIKENTAALSEIRITLAKINGG